ncbi:hypothetical protein BDY19DRAFT_466740 [Irpex rosettiformis]|uniref:Uncharacterized protein n=1 Tax=Irpex rosettiformis TaxID=378272 RepID=A0ACB8TSA4_9APHY|nr:hypothetical protein BDY19DRAFT_466740 [Irpex rosettiformis]
MTFSDLRALHALIGVAIDDIERIYRPNQPAGSRCGSQSSARPTPVSSPISTSTTTSSCSSTNTTDSDAEESGDTDFSLPPTPVSPVMSPSLSINSVRFANGNGRMKKGRGRAATVSSVPQSQVGSPGIMPPPILKQPPLDWPPLDMPMPTPVAVAAASPQPKALTISSPSHLTVPSTPSHSQVTTDHKDNQSGRIPSHLSYSPHTLINPSDEPQNDSISPSPSRRHMEIDVGSREGTPRHQEWKKKCENLTAHPQVINAVNRIVAACGQMAAMVQKPFLTMCDAAMGYHLPSCLRFLEASHIVEILREAGPQGLHVDDIAKSISSGNVYSGEGIIDSNKLSHILRLLATHHIGKEVLPDVFANNRLSSVIDSGKSWRDLVMATPGGKNGPEKKYEDTDGAAAFIGLCTDELFKASAYLTDCYLYPLFSQPISPTKPSFPEDSSDAIPPVPPLPPQPQHLLSAPASNGGPLGMHSSNDSTTSLLSPITRLRKKKSEIGLSINVPASQPNINGPMTFAQNPLQGSPTSASSSTKKGHFRMHSRNSSYASSMTNSDTTGTPPPPLTPSRPSILKRISNRSISSTLELPPRSPLPPLSIIPPVQPPQTPRSPISRTTPSHSLAGAFGTPKSTPARERAQTLDGSGPDLLSTPKSNPHSRNREMATPKSTPSKHSTSSMAGLTISVPENGRRTSPPTPKSPLMTRKQSTPVSMPRVNVNVAEGEYPQMGQSNGHGLLGPAFDFQPPSLVGSPKSRTFPGSVSASPAPTYHESSRKYASPIPPPIPTKSSMRSLRSSANASTTSLASLGETRVRKASGQSVTEGSEMYAPFNVAFNTKMRYFEWLEKSENAFRLKRFGKAMTGTAGWEVPGSVITAFPWHELPRRSVVVDVGGGIGSASMLLANAFPHLRFVIQDRPPVVEMGSAAWRARYPEILDSGRAVFQPHDFFKPQPPFPATLNCELLTQESESASETEGCETIGRHGSERSAPPSVFLMRVITHDWPDSYVTRILLRLRQAAGANTRLVLADFVLPLACVDDVEEVAFPKVEDTTNGRDALKHPGSFLPGTVRTLAPEDTPLLPNLGKASANAYWLDLTMRSMFNSQERTLREFCALTLTAGWKIVQVIRAEGSVFGHLTAIPVEIPGETLRSPILNEPDEDSPPFGMQVSPDSQNTTSATSPPMNETFLSSVDLPSEAVIRQSILSGFIKMNNRKGAEPGKGKRRGRERSSTFTGQRSAPGKDSKGGEVKKGFRSIIRMLSKSQLRPGPTEGSSASRTPVERT